MTHSILSEGAFGDNKNSDFKPTWDNEVLMVVKMNGGEALVLKNKIEKTFYRMDDRTIIGTDGVFYTFYAKDYYSWSKDAFGGRKFTLIMNDGEVVECSGQWWDGMNETHKMLLSDLSLVHVASNDIKSLQNCYVYFGYSADKEKLAKIRSTYTGKVYEYYDGEFILKSMAKPHGKWKSRITSYNGERELIDENNDLFQYRIIQGKLYFRWLWNIEKDNSSLYKEYLTHGKKDFQDKGAKVKSKKPLQVCDECNKERVLTDDNICYQCEKSLDEQERRREYYSSL